MIFVITALLLKFLKCVFQDYPTISQVYKTLQEARIQPIFAVSSTGGRAVDLYKVTLFCEVFNYVSS